MSTVASEIDIGTLYVSHGEWLRGWLRRRTRCAHRAADLTQDTFCRLIEADDTAPVRDARSYLSTVARRILIDDIRRREVERAFLAACEAHGQHVDNLTPERIAEAVELLRATLRLLETLPPRVRQAFIMVRLHGLRYAAAAERLGVSERMAKRYVAQAYAHCYALAYSD